MSTFSLAVIDGEPRVDSRIIAAQLGVDHQNTRELIQKFQGDFEEFGILRFETGEIKGRGQPQKFYLLNEQQAYLLLTYSQNTPQAREFKKRLVQAFGEHRLALEAAKRVVQKKLSPPRLPPFTPIDNFQWETMERKMDDIAHCCNQTGWARFAVSERINELFYCRDHADDVFNIPADQWPAVVKELDELWALGQQHHARMVAAEEDFILNVLRSPKSIAQQRVLARKEEERLMKRRSECWAEEARQRLAHLDRSSS